MIRLPAPKEFSYQQNLQFLKRSPREVLHRTEEDRVMKLLRLEEEMALIRVSGKDQYLQIEFLHGTPSPAVRKYVKSYVADWFDLTTDLKPFYRMARKDDLLKPLVKKYYGYRIIGQPDLFESLVWAVLGQQINVQFAFTLKQRFVENFGDCLTWNNQPYFLFPTPAQVAILNDQDLLPLQFSRQKSKYTVNLAEAFVSKAISKEALQGLPLPEAREMLMKIKGVGNWTANYALMKTFRHPAAFPLEDVAIHNAIKNLKGMKKKPTLAQVKRLFKNYKGWEAYATLYLWKSL